MFRKTFLAFSALYAGFSSVQALGQNNPILVELFTSQGCSSCPPAERWLNRQGMKLFKQGKIVPLAFHVDYWDYLGWKDPSSSKDFTDRQRRYAEALHSPSLYTPEMVVAGRVGFVGSDGARALQEIVSSQNQLNPIPFSWKAAQTPQGIKLQMGSIPATPRLKIWAAVFETGLVTKVERGENAGATLEENFVVRQWLELKRSQHSFLIRWSPSWNPKNIGVAVILQDEPTMEVQAVKCQYPIK